MIRKKIIILFVGITIFLQSANLQANFFSPFWATKDWISNGISENKMATAVIATVAISALGITIYSFYPRKSKSLYAKPQLPKSKGSKPKRSISPMILPYDPYDPSVSICPFDPKNSKHVRCVNKLCEKDYMMLWTVATKENAQRYIQNCKDLFFKGSEEKKMVHIKGAVAGFIAYNYGHINLLAIKEKHRGNRLGGRLIRHAIDHLNELGCDEISILARNTNSAIDLYNRFGFRANGDDGSGKYKYAEKPNPVSLKLRLKD